MYKTRTTNINAAQWSPNGGAMGTLDLTEPANQVFGANVFGPAAQRERLPKTVYKALQVLYPELSTDDLAALACRRRWRAACRSMPPSPTRSRRR